jgi:hypothetical protein
MTCSDHDIAEKLLQVVVKHNHLPTICMHFITKEIEIKGNYLRNNSWKP